MEITMINSAALSVTTGGTKGRFHISWRQYEVDFYQENIEQLCFRGG